MTQLPINMPDLPPYRASVERLTSAENLRTVAAATNDPEVLLGLAFLARAGDPVRTELAEMAARERNEFTPIVAVLTVIMDRIDAASVGDLTHRDPENALGHYLQGALLHSAKRDSDALAAFRKGATRAEISLYETLSADALFKALDGLKITGLDRLCALSWTAARAANFSGAGIQPTYRALSELASSAEITTRTEIAEILLALAGHLFATNFTNRWFAQRAVEAAFLLKAEIAGTENAAMMNGYAAAVHGLTNATCSWAGIGELRKANPLELARFLPSTIHRAFAAADPSLMNAGVLGEANLDPPEGDRAAFTAAKEAATQAARKLIEVAVTDADGILGAYLRGLPRPVEADRKHPWASFGTPVGSLIRNRPDVFKAASAYKEAMDAVWKAGQNDPCQKNIERMMRIAWAIQTYAHSHQLACPESIDILFETGQLKFPLEGKSLLTGRSYVYVADGEMYPARSNDQAQFVLIYDDHINKHDYHQCVFASCVGGDIRVDKLMEHLKGRGETKG
jgi:hypothetical protein